jgi:hypothetical protein
MTAALGSPSPGGACLTRTTIPAQRFPRLRELVVTVGRVPGREEYHVVAVAKRHELQAPKPPWPTGVDVRGQPYRKNDGKTMLACSGPLPGAPTVGVWSYEGPKPTSESMLRVPNLDGDVRRIHGGLSWFGQKKTLRLAGRGYCISLHLSACVVVTSYERGN